MGFYQISEISLNGERYPGLLVKFLRPIPGKEGKKLTIKILSSGKINLDGANVQAGSVGAIDGTNVTLRRLEGGFFDSIDFSGVGNRGYITIRYA